MGFEPGDFGGVGRIHYGIGLLGCSWYSKSMIRLGRLAAFYVTLGGLLLLVLGLPSMASVSGLLFYPPFALVFLSFYGTPILLLAIGTHALIASRSQRSLCDVN